MDNTLQEIWSQCRVEDGILRLPSIQLDRKVYDKVKKQLEAAGGKWKSGKAQGFVFADGGAQEVLDGLLIGEDAVKEKKTFQFFGTPDDLADEIVVDADIQEGDVVLEPSAGQGAIIKAIYRAFPKVCNSVGELLVRVDYCELMPKNQKLLSEAIVDKRRTNFMCPDFLAMEVRPLTNQGRSEAGLPLIGYDKIIANPPFANNQDIMHVMHMFDLLRPGGRLVSIMSPHFTFSTDKASKDFVDFLAKYGSWVAIPAGRFKAAGTMIRTVKVIIDKPSV